jgi:hypothetical protein
LFSLKAKGEETPEIYEIDFIQRLLDFKEALLWGACFRYFGGYAVYLLSIIIIPLLTDNEVIPVALISFWTVV